MKCHSLEFDVFLRAPRKKEMYELEYTTVSGHSYYTEYTRVTRRLNARFFTNSKDSSSRRSRGACWILRVHGTTVDLSSTEGRDLRYMYSCLRYTHKDVFLLPVWELADCWGNIQNPVGACARCRLTLTHPEYGDAGMC